MKKKPINVFVSYTHQDKMFKDELLVSLASMSREQVIKVWHDQDVKPGDNWKEKTKEALEAAQIILLLVSPDFIASDYIHSTELQTAIEKYRRGEIIIMPILIRSTYLHGTPLEGFHALPYNKEAIALWRNKDSAWFEVTSALRDVVLSIRDTSIRLTPPRAVVPPPMDGDIPEDIFEKAKNQIAKGKSQKGMKILLDNQYIKKMEESNELLILYSYLNSVQKDQKKNVISDVDANIIFNRVNSHLLHTVDALQKTVARYEQA